MVTAIVLTLALGCPKVVAVNISGLPWEAIDSENMKVAGIRCGQKFSDAPCLVQFVKVEKQMYRAICGARR
jgi:hypothetical protein